VAWDALWRSVFSTAVIYCGCFSKDLGERRRWAAVAFEHALAGIEPKVRRGRLTWYGRLSFVAHVRTRVVECCREVCRAELGRDSEGPVRE
jgi:hypothetical protein